MNSSSRIAVVVFVLTTMFRLSRGFAVVASRRRSTIVRMVASSSPMNADQSAVSKSRPAFRMPRNSPDDSKASISITKNEQNMPETKELTWNPLGLYTELVDCLENDMGLEAPTPVQSLVIPELLKEERGSLAFLSATGSGKTLSGG